MIRKSGDFMIIKVREQAGTDAVRKFDYQMALALDFLLSEIDSDVIVLIETLEDFAVFHNFGTEFEKVDVYQVKTKDKGLYTKKMLYNDNVLGKIILTDFYFNSKANTLNIVCNTALKGTSTENLDDFVFEDTLTSKEILELKANVTEYLDNNSDFDGKADEYIGKLIYIKSSLPFTQNDDRYSEALIGKTNNTIACHLDDDNHSINPQVVFNALKLLIDKQRRNKITTSEITVDEAISKKGIKTSQLKEIISAAAACNNLTKKELLQHAATIFSSEEYIKIKNEYSVFLSCKMNLSDRAFIDAKNIMETECQNISSQYDSLDEIIRNASYNCVDKISYYSLPVIQMIAIDTMFS